MDYQGRQFHPHYHHTWNSLSISAGQSLETSNSNSSINKKSRGRKVKKSESESGISKLLKTLRKDSSGKKAAAAEKLRGREPSPSSVSEEPVHRQRRGSLDCSPTRKRTSSPDRRRAKSMDRRAEQSQRDRTPEREQDDGGFLAVTPERKFYERRLLKDSQAAGRARETTTPERNKSNGDSSSLSRGRTYDRGTKNGNLLRDSSSERYRLNGTPERRYRVERDSSPDSNYSRDELNYAAAPRPKDYYSVMKNNTAHNSAAYNNTGHYSKAVGNSPNQLPEPKRRLYKDSPKDLSI